MKAKILSLSILSILSLVILMSFVSAAVILTDNFDDGNLNGWTITNDPSSLPGTEWVNTGTNAEAIPGSASTLGTTVLERTISTSGFQSIIVKYDRQLVGFDTEEEFVVSWSTDGTNFNVVEETLNDTPDDTNFVSKSFNLASSANNNANFQVKVECTTNAQADLCKLDNFQLEGTAIPITQDDPQEVTECELVGNPLNDLRVKDIDFNNKGMNGESRTELGDDDAWFPLDDIEVEIELENKGDEDIDNIEIEWGVWDTNADEWIIELDDEKDFDLNDDDEDTIMVKFNLEDKLDVDLDELNDGDHYRFYVIATGESDELEEDVCVSDFEDVEIVIEEHFVALHDFMISSFL